MNEKAHEGVALQREAPGDLSIAALSDALQRNYGIAVADLKYLALGADSRAWVYDVQAQDGCRYFLKARMTLDNPSSLVVPHYLHARGVLQVAAPIDTSAKELYARLDDYFLILYPFLDGITGKVRGMNESQWSVYGETLRQIHSSAAACELAHLLGSETYVPAGVAAIRRLQAQLAEAQDLEATANKLLDFWNQQQDSINLVCERAEELGRRLAAMAPPAVLCHADIHTNNVMVDRKGKIWIVDWDETVLAPKERDLMFILDGGISRRLVSRENEQWFMQGYGEATIDRLAIAYYKYAWAVSDIGEFGLQVFGRPDLGPVARSSAVNSFKILFQPGNIVSLALEQQI